jgi:hypothetical protein
LVGGKSKARETTEGQDRQQPKNWRVLRMAS